MLLEKKKEKNGGNFVFTSGKQPKGLSIAPKTLANFLERKTQLYEQGADVRRIGKYVRNWWRWVRAGVVFGVRGSVFLTLLLARPAARFCDVVFLLCIPGRLRYMVVWYTPSASS